MKEQTITAADPVPYAPIQDSTPKHHKPAYIKTPAGSGRLETLLIGFLGGRYLGNLREA